MIASSAAELVALAPENLKQGKTCIGMNGIVFMHFEIDHFPARLFSPLLDHKPALFERMDPGALDLF